MITLDEVQADLHEIVDGKPDDYAYSTVIHGYATDGKVAETMEGSDCLYFWPEAAYLDDEGDLMTEGVDESKPCCLVGQVLAKHEMTALTESDNMAAFRNVGAADEFEPLAFLLLARVQRLQDLGMPWRRALAWAEHAFGDPEVAARIDRHMSNLDAFEGMPREHAATEMESV